jgi:DMSO/TMAO reductase YedYZ heme-binding membrane subunit
VLWKPATPCSLFLYPMLKTVRKLHSTIAPFVLLPLLMTVTTGVVYRLGKSWFGLSRDQVHFLMTLHEGEYLGPTLEPIYVLLNGLGLLWMITTGGLMAWQNLRRSQRQRQHRSATPASAGESEGSPS